MCSKTHPGPKITPKTPQEGQNWPQCTSCGPINWFWAKKTKFESVRSKVCSFHSESASCDKYQFSSYLITCITCEIMSSTKIVCSGTWSLGGARPWARTQQHPRALGGLRGGAPLLQHPHPQPQARPLPRACRDPQPCGNMLLNEFVHPYYFHLYRRTTNTSTSTSISIQDTVMLKATTTKSAHTTTTTRYMATTRTEGTTTMFASTWGRET